MEHWILAEMERHRYGVDVEIFESGKKKLWIQIYPDTCGRGLILVNRRFNMAAQNK